MSTSGSKIALVTGIGGQDGFYLADLLLACGYDVVGTSHREDAGPHILINGTAVPVARMRLDSTEEVRAHLEKV